MLQKKTKERHFEQKQNVRISESLYLENKSTGEAKSHERLSQSVPWVIGQFLAAQKMRTSEGFKQGSDLILFIFEKNDTELCAMKETRPVKSTLRHLSQRDSSVCLVGLLQQSTENPVTSQPKYVLQFGGPEIQDHEI